MKIAIQTLPLRYNFGGILQNFALQYVIKQLGHEVVTLDYIDYPELPLTHRLFAYTKRFIKKKLFHQQDIDIFIEKNRRKELDSLCQNTNKFIDKYIRRTFITNLKKDISCISYDAYIVGSDQVWRPEYNTNFNNMFLTFTKNWKVKRIAYAASFGIDRVNISSKDKHKFRNMLNKFNGISVREKSGVKLCEDLFAIKSQQVLDPCMLLTAEEYTKSIDLSKIKRKEKMLLVYILDENDSKRIIVEKISREMNLIPVYINSKINNCNLDIKERIQKSVEQWLRYFIDAEYVVTDSFHASVFSILFRKQFIILNNTERGETRLKSLLETFSIGNRMVKNSNDLKKVITKPIIYDKVYEILEIKKAESISFLVKSLNS